MSRPSGLLETGPREGVVVAGVGVVEEAGAWAEETASTPAARETSTDTAATTNRESAPRPLKKCHSSLTKGASRPP